MRTKTVPDVEINCYPLGANLQMSYLPLVIADNFGASLFPGMGDGVGGFGGYGEAGFGALNPTIKDEWFRQPEYSRPPQNVQFARFRTGGDFVTGTAAAQPGGGNGSEGAAGEELSGWMLQARQAALDLKIGSNAALVDGGNTDWNWDGIAGQWRTVAPPGRAPFSTGIMNSGAHSEARARSRGELPANRALWLEFDFLGMLPGTSAGAATSAPGIQVGIGNDLYLLSLLHGQKVAVGKALNGAPRVLKWLDGGDTVNLSSGRLKLLFGRVAGRLVVEINGRAFWILESEELRVADERGQTHRALTSAWPAGAVTLTCLNCRALLRGGMVKYSTPGGAAFIGSVARAINRRAPLSPNGGTDAQQRELAGYTGGWAREGTGAVVRASVGDGKVEYTCTLTASSDGISSPFVSKVLCYHAPGWKELSPAPLNVRGAATGLRISGGTPPGASGAEGTLDLDRVRLEALTPNWRDFVTGYRRVEIRARWNYSDGTTDADYHAIFKGEFFGAPRTGTDGFGRKTLSAQLCDPIAALREPSAVVDHRHPPMDVFFAKLFSGDALFGGSGAATFYDYDAVREILGLYLGTAHAERLLVLVPPSHPPLLSRDTDRAGYLALQMAFGASAGAPPTAGGFLLPAPYGQDAISWIHQYAKLGRCLFFYGYGANDNRRTEWPRPIYGRLRNILAGRPNWRVPDAVYLAGDQNRVMSGVDVETRPERDINRVLAWSSPPGSEVPFLPALRMAESRVEEFDPDDPKRASLSRERTKVLRSDLAWVSGGVEALAQIVAREIAGVGMEWPRVRLFGDGRIAWGDKLTPEMSKTLMLRGVEVPQSDVGLRLSGETHRVESVEHDLNFDATGMDAWRTVAACRPLSASERGITAPGSGTGGDGSVEMVPGDVYVAL